MLATNNKEKFIVRNNLCHQTKIISKMTLNRTLKIMKLNISRLAAR